MTKQQEKCVCENPRVCHQEECGEIGKHCTVCLKPIAAPSPHQEGWEEKLNIALKGSALARPAVIKVFREALLSTHSADIVAFKGMIEEEIIPSKNIPIMANGIWVGKKDPLIVRHNKTLKELTQKLQEYEKEEKV